MDAALSSGRVCVEDPNRGSGGSEASYGALPPPRRRVTRKGSPWTSAVRGIPTCLRGECFAQGGGGRSQDGVSRRPRGRGRSPVNPPRGAKRGGHYYSSGGASPSSVDLQKVGVFFLVSFSFGDAENGWCRKNEGDHCGGGARRSVRRDASSSPN